ncbi:HAUS augmin-like complex subunit 6 isoform X2 [Nothoprocta perdicaria]|nr:HAUS augmin-like complex subunit 6 isoform X2 [Nothoprocta perdicaria]
MFDAPNNEAFHTIALFLFTKLDPSRAAEMFRDCSLPGDRKGDPEFRKQCFTWLKEIAEEDRSTFPQIAASLFLSAGGPKFIDLMYQFARYVLIQDIKVNSVGTDIPFANIDNLIQDDPYLTKARCRTACNKLLQMLQKEDYIIREHKKKAWLLNKEIRKLKLECAGMKLWLLKKKRNDRSKIGKTERIQKVRNMWTFVMDTLSSLKMEKEVVDSVLDGRADQYALDGTNFDITIPQVLINRIEGERHKLCIEKIHEEEKLNFLTIVQLLNEALRIFRDEFNQLKSKEHLQYIRNEIEFQSKVIVNLKKMSQKIEQEYFVPTSESVSEKQEEWEVKWKNYLDCSPFCLAANKDPELGLLPTVQPLSFYPATEETYENSDFCQHSDSISDILESVCDGNYDDEDDEDDGALENVTDKAILTPERRLSQGSQESLELISSFENSTELLEQVLSTENFIWEEQPASANMLKDGVDEPTIEETGKNKDAHIIQRECPLREDSLEKAQQQLAEEVAKAVMYDSPQSSGEKGAELEDLISSLSSNPFITRKQIPRTPENLLTEIRSSWREAIRSEDSTDTEMLSSEVITETPKAVKAVVQKSIPNSTSSPVINFDYYHSERKSHLSCIELSPERQIKINHVSRSSVKETTRISENDRIEKQELENILNKTETVPYEKKSIDTQDSSSENRRRILSPEHLEDSFMDRIQLFSSSFDSHEPAQLGMFREILSDPGQSPSSELNFDIPDNIYLPGSRENERDISVDLESVLSRYETLKRTLSRSEEEQTPAADESLNCFSDLDFIRVDTEGTDLEKTFYLDEDFLNTLSSPVTFSESNPSLSPLLVRSRYLERMVSALNRMPFDSVHKLKDEEHLSKKLDTKEPL